MEMVVRGIIVYIDTDKDGYVSVLTDGIHPTTGKEAIEAIISGLRSVQTCEDLEHEQALHSSRRRCFK